MKKNDNNKLEKILKYGIILLIIILIGTMVLIVIEKRKPDDDYKPGEQIVLPDTDETSEDYFGEGGEGGEYIDDNFYNIEVTMNEKFVSQFDVVCTDDLINILHNGETKTYTMKTLIQQFEFDATEYDAYNCDYEKSYVKITKLDGFLEKGSFLACDWPNN